LNTVYPCTLVPAGRHLDWVIEVGVEPRSSSELVREGASRTGEHLEEVLGVLGAFSLAEVRGGRPHRPVRDGGLPRPPAPPLPQRAGLVMASSPGAIRAPGTGL
jgi:hypothetical protein